MQLLQRMQNSTYFEVSANTSLSTFTRDHNKNESVETNTTLFVLSFYITSSGGFQALFYKFQFT